MKTSVEHIDDTTVKLSVTIEAERVTQAVDEAARHLAREVRIPGFRPGKAPRRVLETRLGKGALLEHAARDALPGFYAEAVAESELDVVGPPSFDVDTFEDGRDAAFEVTVEVRPDIDLPDYASMQIPHPDWEVTDEDVAGELDRLRERFAELETVKRPAQTGDYVVITLTGERGGQRVEEASEEDVLYQVSDPEESGAELDRQLAGAKAGAILKFSDALGSDYGELAGQELDFTTIVKEVKAKQLPALDDDFAITASEFDTIDELRQDLRDQLRASKRAAARAALRGRVVEAVCEATDVPLPESLVTQQVRFRLSRLSGQAEQYGLTLDQYFQMTGATTEQAVEQLQDEARKTVKAQLVVDAVGRAAGLEVTEEDLGTEVARQSARLNHPPEELAKFMTHPDRIGALVSDAFRRKAIDHLLAHVEVLSSPPEDDRDLQTLADDPEGAVEGQAVTALVQEEAARQQAAAAGAEDEA